MNAWQGEYRPVTADNSGIIGSGVGVREGWDG